MVVFVAFYLILATFDDIIINDADMLLESIDAVPHWRAQMQVA